MARAATQLGPASVSCRTSSKCLNTNSFFVEHSCHVRRVLTIHVYPVLERVPSAFCYKNLTIPGGFAVRPIAVQCLNEQLIAVIASCCFWLAILTLRDIQTQVDVWALGCLVVEIISNRLPHEAGGADKEGEMIRCFLKVLQIF